MCFLAVTEQIATSYNNFSQNLHNPDKRPCRQEGRVENPQELCILQRTEAQPHTGRHLKRSRKELRQSGAAGQMAYKCA